MQTNTMHCEAEPKNIDRSKRLEGQFKQSNQLSFPHQDDFKTRNGHNVVHTTTKTKILINWKSLIKQFWIVGKF